MQHFNIFVKGAKERDGVYRDVEASTVRAAIAKVIGVRYQAGTKLGVGDELEITVRRWQ